MPEMLEPGTTGALAAAVHLGEDIPESAGTAGALGRPPAQVAPPGASVERGSGR